MEPITDGNVISIPVEARKIPGVYIVFTHRTAFHCLRASLVAQMVKNVPALQETWVQPLGQEDPLEKGNPMDRGAWWATVHDVAKSWIRLSHELFLSKKYLLTYVFDLSDLCWGMRNVAFWCLGLPSCGTQALEHVCSVIVVCGLSCFAVRGIVLP